MDLTERFSDILAAALHAQASEENLDTIQETLFALADRERAMPLPSECPGIEDARYAVYAWVDEKLLNAERPDAAAWMPRSLQCRYFSTTEAGQGFFVRLNDLLDTLGIPRDVEENLAPRLELAGALPENRPGRDVLDVFALCLLYGFRGRLFAQEDLLLRVRKVCARLLSRPESVVLKENVHKPGEVRHGPYLERLAYVLLPLLVCVVFWFFCASLLANTVPISSESKGSRQTTVQETVQPPKAEHPKTQEARPES